MFRKNPDSLAGGDTADNRNSHTDGKHRTGGCGNLPVRPEPGAMIAAALGGVTGGLFGISGPPLIWYFGSRYPRRVFRRIIVPLFLVDAVGRSVIYAGMGLLHRGELGIALGLLPGLIIGLFIGNHWFNVIPQQRFERMIGGVLILSGLKLCIAV